MQILSRSAGGDEDKSRRAEFALRQPAQIGWKGGEITFTRPGCKTPDLRINLFGDKNWPPHYHRRPGIGKHGLWDGGW